MGDKLLNYLLSNLGQGKSNVELLAASREPLGEQVGWGLVSFRKKSFPFPISIPCTHLRLGVVLSGRQDQPQHFVSAETGTCPSGDLLCALCSQTLLPVPNTLLSLQGLPSLQGLYLGAGSCLCTCQGLLQSCSPAVR